MPNRLSICPRVSPWLFGVAGIQAINGFFLTAGCLCEPDLRSVGMIAATGMAAVVGLNLALGFMASARPRAAVAIALGTEGVLLPLMALPAITAPAAVWWIQAPVILALGVASVEAFKRCPRPTGK